MIAIIRTLNGSQVNGSSANEKAGHTSQSESATRNPPRVGFKNLLVGEPAQLAGDQPPGPPPSPRKQMIHFALLLDLGEAGLQKIRDSVEGYERMAQGYAGYLMGKGNYARERAREAQEQLAALPRPLPSLKVALPNTLAGWLGLLLVGLGLMCFAVAAFLINLEVYAAAVDQSVSASAFALIPAAIAAGFIPILRFASAVSRGQAPTSPGLWSIAMLGLVAGAAECMMLGSAPLLTDGGDVGLAAARFFFWGRAALEMLAVFAGITVMLASLRIVAPAEPEGPVSGERSRLETERERWAMQGLLHDRVAAEWSGIQAEDLRKLGEKVLHGRAKLKEDLAAATTAETKLALDAAFKAFIELLLSQET